MPLIDLSPHFLDLLAPSVSISAGVHQIVCSVRRMNKEGFEVLGLGA